MADPATHATLVAAKQRAESEIEGRRAELLALSHAIHAKGRPGFDVGSE